MNAHRPTGGRAIGRLATGLLSTALVLAACSSAAAPSAPAPSTAPSENPTQSPPDSPVTAPPSDGTGQIPVEPGGKFVVPKPGQLDVHPVQADSLAARVDGSTIVVTATWTSGVEPCNVLDSIEVRKGQARFTITLREGHGPEEVVCIAIAEQHKTEFEIRGVAPGTYTLVDSGTLAPPIEITVG